MHPKPLTAAPGRHALAFLFALALTAALAPSARADGPPTPCKPPAQACDCKPYPCCEPNCPKDPTCPPKYANRRFVENWRPCLCADWCDKQDWSDVLKARSLSGNGWLWVNVGGQLRLRWESFANQNFGAPADPHDAWLLGRARAHADVHFGDHVRAFVEGIYANQWELRELGPRPIDRNLGDLLNAFAEVEGRLGASKAGAWVGRRELETGAQRLVSPLDWANTRRTFQGAGAWWKSGNHAVDAWATRPVIVDFDDFDDWDADRLFWGVDYTNTSLTCLTWGAYVMGLHDDARPGRVAQDRYTLGARIDGKLPRTRFDYAAEAAYQLGSLGAGDISAFMVCVDLGWKPCLPRDARLGVGFDYASGDDDLANPDSGTFNQLFPLGHKYLGHADLIGRQNLVAARVEASYELFDKLTLGAWYHLFWRADTADHAYNAAGGVLRAVPMGGNTQSQVGSELDVALTYKIDRHWTVTAEWCRFFTGDFIRTTGASRDVDVWYLGAELTF